MCLCGRTTPIHSHRLPVVRGVARTFLLGGCESINLPTRPSYFFLHKFCQKVDPLKICAAKSDKQKKNKRNKHKRTKK